MSVEANWQVIFRNVLEHGYTLLLYSLATVFQFFGLPLFLAGAMYDLKNPCFHSPSTKKSGKRDFSAPSDSDMTISDIKSFDYGACWTVSFLEGVHGINENRLLLLQKEHIFCKKTSVSICKNVKMKGGDRAEVERAMDKLLQCEPFDYGDFITVQFLNDGNDDSVTTSGFEDEESEESDDDAAQYSDPDSFGSYLDDSDDLEVVFDDSADAGSWHKEFCPFVQTDDFLAITNCLEKEQDICPRTVFPILTDDFQCVNVTDIFSANDRAKSEEFLKSYKTLNCEEFPSTHDFPAKSNKTNNFTNLNGKKNKKTVSFAVEKDLITVHPMVKWNFAYRNARKGPWERYACDRFHFQSRIQSCEPILGPILERKYYQYLNANI